jgi:hypothetical protein
MFKRIDHKAARTIVEELHHSHTFPERSTHIFGYYYPDLCAIMCIGDWCNFKEFISYVRTDAMPLAASKFISLCMGALASEKYDLAGSWVNPIWGSGTMFKGAGWAYHRNYLNRRDYFYWHPIRKTGRLKALEFELRSDPYPR